MFTRRTNLHRRWKSRTHQ